MSKKKTRPVVRGPQQKLKLAKAKGEPPRTARVRYLEPPTKKEGNPFFAVRVPGDVLKGFQRACAAKKESPQNMVREFMSKVGGVPLAVEEAGE